VILVDLILFRPHLQSNQSKGSGPLAIKADFQCILLPGIAMILRDATYLQHSSENSSEQLVGDFMFAA